MNELSNDLRKALHNAGKEHIRRKQYDDYLSIRAALKARIEEVAIDGMIGIDWDKMDCDHAKWGGHSHIPATVMYFIAWENDFYDAAEGPQSAFIVRPRDETGKLYERDLALEAHENGHPHCIHI